MKVLTFIQMLEVLLKEAGVTKRPNPLLLKTVIKLRWLDFTGKAQINDGSYVLTTDDGIIEYKMPQDLQTVESVWVNGVPATKLTKGQVMFKQSEG